MKKLILLFILSSGFCRAQDTLLVQETERKYSIGNKNSFVIDIPQAQLKKIQNNWKTYLKQQSKRPASTDNGEIILPFGIIPVLGNDSIKIFSTVTSEGKSIKLSAAVMNQDSTFLSGELSAERSSAFRHFIRQFAIKEYRLAVSEEFISEKEKLKSLEKKVNSLENENEDLRKDIKKNERSIVRLKDEIMVNEQEQSLKTTSILQQKTILNNYTGSEESRIREEKLLKQFTKEKGKLQDSKESLMKKIDDYESENRDIDKKIDKNNEENIPEAKNKVLQQKNVVKNTETKLNNIQ